MAKNSVSTVIKSENVFGLPLVSVVDGCKLGQVKDVVVDSVRRKVVGLLIEDVEWQKGLKILPISAVVKYGEDAVTVKTAKGIPVNKASRMKKFAGVVAVTGASVYDLGGQAIGKLLSVSFNLDSGEAVSCELEVFGKEGRHSVSSEDVVTFGAGAILVKEEVLLAPIPRVAKKAVPRKAKVEPKVPKVRKGLVGRAAARLAKEASKLAEEKVVAKMPAEAVVKEKPKVKEREKLKEKVKAEPLVKEVLEKKVEAKPKREVEKPRPKKKVKPREEVPRPELGTKVKPAKKLVKKLAKEVTMGDFLIGQKVANRVVAEDGSVIVEAGEVVTEEVVEKARAARAFLQLSFSVEREVL